jgi:hypothetical protein
MYYVLLLFQIKFHLSHIDDFENQDFFHFTFKNKYSPVNCLVCYAVTVGVSYLDSYLIFLISYFGHSKYSY